MLKDRVFDSLREKKEWVRRRLISDGAWLYPASKTEAPIWQPPSPAVAETEQQEELSPVHDEIIKALKTATGWETAALEDLVDCFENYLAYAPTVVRMKEHGVVFTDGRWKRLQRIWAQPN